MGKLTRTTRRGRIAGLGIGLLLATASLITAQAASAAAPQADIEGFYATLLATMKAGPSLGESGRYRQLAPSVQRVFDIPAMARLAVGPSWADLDPTRRQQVIGAFGHYIAATYADRFDRYSGEQLQVVAERPLGYGTIVETRIVKSDGKPVTINYLMRQTGVGTWQVADVYLDGTISQLAVQHSEFAAILRDRGVDGLVAALNRKVDLLTKSAAS